MLVIRLFRVGKKNQPAFKVVVTDKTRPTRAGRFLEVLGFYNTLTKKRDFKADRIKYWISVGAKTSDTVHNLLVSEKIISGKKIASHNKVEKPLEQSSTGKAAEPTSVVEAPKAETLVEQPKMEVPVVESIDATQDKEKSVEESKVEAPVENTKPETPMDSPVEALVKEGENK